jgi:hypothetical protein
VYVCALVLVFVLLEIRGLVCVLVLGWVTSRYFVSVTWCVLVLGMECVVCMLVF